MFKILLGLGLGYIGYVIIKQVAASLGLWPQAPRPLDKEGEPDVLVQDPVCKTFIPRREALRAEKDGASYFFCSEGCLKRFLSGDKN
jgi:YHS domain-containing protein